MATFAELVTRVVNKYKGSSGTSFTTQAEQAINDAIEYYQTEHFWFTEGTASVTLSVGDPDVSSASGFPTDFWYVHSDGGLAVVQSNSRFDVTKVSVSEYDAMNTEGTGRPRYYRDLGNTIEVYPYPDQAYTLEFRYIKKYTALSGSSTNDFTTFAPQLIEARALAMLFLSEGQDGAEPRTSWQGVETQQLMAMRLASNQRLATGNLQTD
jgi:hypothetical protein